MFSRLISKGNISQNRLELIALIGAVRDARKSGEYNITVRSNKTYVVEIFDEDGHPKWGSIHANHDLISDCYDQMKGMNVRNKNLVYVSTLTLGQLSVCSKK